VKFYVVFVYMKHVRRILLESILPKFRINEYFQVHVDDTIHKLTSAILGMFQHSAPFISTSLTSLDVFDIEQP